MDQSEVMNRILDEANAFPLEETSEQPPSKLIFFRIGEASYALPAEDVQEIMLGLTIHYLPFLPPFVRGLINRLGEPVTVIDLQSLFHGELNQGQAFLILKSHISKMAFLIDEVQDIALVQASQIGKVANSLGALDAYVSGVVPYRGGNVLLLNDQSIVLSVKKAVDA